VFTKDATNALLKERNLPSDDSLDSFFINLIKVIENLDFNLLSDFHYVNRHGELVIGMNKVRLAIPNGHLSKETLETFARAGYRISGEKRIYTPIINDHHIEVRVLRPQEIPTFVTEGLQDIGITGRDWMRETKADVELLLDLEYSKVKLVVAIPENLNRVKSISDLLRLYHESGKQFKLFTEYLTIAIDVLSENEVYKELYGSEKPIIVTPWGKRGSNPEVGVFLSFGATEAKPPAVADAIIEIVDTGASLKQNSLKILEVIMESTAVLIANKKALRNPEKREKIYDIMTLLKGVVEARRKLHIYVNVERKHLDTLLSEMPALRKPTISPLSDPNWVAVNTIVDRTRFLQLVPTLRNLAQGLVVYEPRQVLPLYSVTQRGRPDDSGN
jgi:ATP phosphoribosyltransferase